jgi:hypothetical protein
MWLKLRILCFIAKNKNLYEERGKSIGRTYFSETE